MQAPHPAPATVLVVDDDPMNRRVARGALETQHRVLEAPDGPAALDLVESVPVDLVLLDVMMPGMSGFEVCRRLKARPAPWMPVLLLTALSEQADRNEGLAAGADDFLTKPFDRHELRLRVAAFLRLGAQEALIRRQFRDLEELTSLKDDLVSMVVHDIRNPLAAAGVTLECLEGRLPVGDADVAALRRQQARIAHLVEDLLTIRRMEEGAALASREPAEFGALLGEAVATVQAAAHARQVRIEVQSDVHGSFSLDRGLALRAVENLLSNAVRHAPPGSAVEIDVERCSPTNGLDGAGVELRVLDRGPGIAESLRPRLFEKFATTSALGRRSGFGLGLYLVRLVAQLHGGTAEALDRDGGGTVFRLRFGEEAP